MLQLVAGPEIGEASAMHDRTGPTGRAFQVQLKRLGNVLSVLSAVRWYCEKGEGPTEFVNWLPHEKADTPPPSRNLKVFLFRESKPVWEWCLEHRSRYATRFLSMNSVVRVYATSFTPNPVPVRPLSGVLDEFLLGQSEFDRLRSRYDGR